MERFKNYRFGLVMESWQVLTVTVRVEAFRLVADCLWKSMSDALNFFLPSSLPFTRTTNSMDGTLSTWTRYSPSSSKLTLPLTSAAPDVSTRDTPVTVAEALPVTVTNREPLTPSMGKIKTWMWIMLWIMLNLLIKQIKFQQYIPALGRVSRTSYPVKGLWANSTKSNRKSMLL